MPKVLYILFLCFLFSCSSNIDKGAKSLYKSYCVTCHGITGDLKTNGAIDLKLSSLTLDERIVVIKKGRNIMPSFESTLSQDEIKKIAEFTFTLNQNGSKQ